LLNKEISIQKGNSKNKIPNSNLTIGIWDFSFFGIYFT